MSLHERLTRRLCPTCLPNDPLERHPTIGVLERSADALDRLAWEIRRIREEMADGPNPYLGDAPRGKKERGNDR